MVTMGEFWVTLTSVVAATAMFRTYFPYEIWLYVERFIHKLIRFFNPYIEITFHEYSGKFLKRNEAFTDIRNYLSTRATLCAKRFKADVVQDSKSLILSMEEREEVTDMFKGVKVWWELRHKAPSKTQSISWYGSDDDKRYFKLRFHKRHQELITGTYVQHVLAGGKDVAVRNRIRKLFSNNPSKNWYGWRQSKWSHVPFEHPATFDSLAMERKKKEEIKNDLKKYSDGKEYYTKIGKPWKRGYLLYGPPGTGKSTMISAIANFLNYDVYDLELTTVMDNSELKNLLIETTNKSVIVIEDIDCSLDLTGQREKKKGKDEDKEEQSPIEKKMKEEGENKVSKVTLSGLLNCIDGLWSACGGERIIVFTTNYVDKLDPALIRRGRMDRHIEMSYCCFDAFKVLAKNYLDIDSHELFAEVSSRLAETNMIPADVAEHLMPKSDEDDAETCLKNLIKALKLAKKEAIKKAEEEVRSKAEKEKEGDKCTCSAKKDMRGDETSTKSVKENGFINQEDKGVEN
ncbi:AAA-ATPase ASD, mitochondrial-like [Mangifera indica]|uniref:AAA-ATPase ASD, mitochondrial-like n=1 Tax=Mangifera indica TaxID=29780 RepID=UPI001CF9FDA2|nr:AAA-ATPase ASD, mitochondrial-like [Mangifera indica]